MSEPSAEWSRIANQQPPTAEELDAETRLFAELLAKTPEDLIEIISGRKDFRLKPTQPLAETEPPEGMWQTLLGRITMLRQQQATQSEKPLPIEGVRSDFVAFTDHENRQIGRPSETEMLHIETTAQVVAGDGDCLKPVEGTLAHRLLYRKVKGLVWGRRAVDLEDQQAVVEEEFEWPQSTDPTPFQREILARFALFRTKYPLSTDRRHLNDR